MDFVRLLPVIISFLLLAAHFLRAGNNLIVLFLLALLPLLIYTKPWVPRVMQVVLLLAAVEWLRTLVSVAGLRIELGMPWARMAIILGAVALLTLFSGLVFRTKQLRKRYAGAGLIEHQLPT